MGFITAPHNGTSPGEFVEHPDEIKNNFNLPDGNYYLQPRGESSPTQLYCDLSNDGGGWMLMLSHNLWGDGASVSAWAPAAFSGSGFSGQSLNSGGSDWKIPRDYLFFQRAGISDIRVQVHGQEGTYNYVDTGNIPGASGSYSNLSIDYSGTNNEHGHEIGDGLYWHCGRGRLSYVFSYHQGLADSSDPHTHGSLREHWGHFHEEHVNGGEYSFEHTQLASGYNGATRLKFWFR